ncbi:MarR family transcriptional regulator [Pseudodesulfovibrio sp. JC047]|uniref:MarR family winged helix-turn-helix transcriptional regulator n=1 Tax=Pseudodesulfovibrio sp. JC047 TaxID=2683199 RepID=UPI0013D70460|nr:MarR family transcriptional regulator [Pseudodesulfovibrio sp. JC047]NDV19985.1 MarR family transcriptional regulator [Pseudodesulfovibrio sp. JC047]
MIVDFFHTRYTGIYMSHADTSFFFTRISNLYRLYAKALDARLEPYNVRPGYIEILNKLWLQDTITQKQLHAQLSIEQATLSNTLKRMERDGLIQRKRSHTDRRSALLLLTDTAKDLQKTVHAAVTDLQSVVNQGLSINDRRYFAKILHQMTTHLESDVENPCLVLFDEILEK